MRLQGRGEGERDNLARRATATRSFNHSLSESVGVIGHSCEGVSGTSGVQGTSGGVDRSRVLDDRWRWRWRQGALPLPNRLAPTYGMREPRADERTEQSEETRDARRGVETANV